MMIHPTSVVGLTASENIPEGLLEDESLDPVAALAVYLRPQLARRWAEVTYLDGATVLDAPMNASRLRRGCVAFR